MNSLRSRIKWHIKKNKLEVAGQENIINCYESNVKNTYIEVKGHGNLIFIDKTAHLSDCKITIYGDNNVIQINDKCSIYSLEIWIEGVENKIAIGSNTYIAGKTHLAAVEGTTISIGDDCMLSSEIHITTTDSHSITDLEGRRINPSKDIAIGKHCWIGKRVMCLKGTEIAENCVVGAASLLAGKYCTPNCAWGGNPAKLLKQDINWCRERI